MNKHSIWILVIVLVLLIVVSGVFYFMFISQPIAPVETGNEMSGMYSRLEAGGGDSDISQSTLGEVIENKIKDIQITEYYGGWASVAEAKKELLNKLNDRNISISSAPLWNLDIPVQLVGTIEYTNGVTGIVVVVQHRVGFQDDFGESWYFQWEERLSSNDMFSSKTMSCERFMGDGSEVFQDNTDESVLSECDDESFVELSHEYGKDKNFVYFRPMPNANKMTIILDSADPKTFELIDRCPGLASDKNHVYEIGRIVEDKNPAMLKRGYIEGNPGTYCY